MDVSIPLAAFGLGVALGASPGPVQLLLFSEASRGGAGRGLRAMAGANATFGLMMLLLAAGLSSLEPGDTFLRVVKVIGGAFLVFLAVDAIREEMARLVEEGLPADELAAVGEYDYAIFNEDLVVAVAQVAAILDAEARRVSRQEGLTSFIERLRRDVIATAARLSESP